MRLNQRGITLVELLAALALVSIIAIGAWTALSIGLKHSAVETNKTSMQQDANLIVSKLTNAHRKSDMYKLKFESNQLILSTCNYSSSAVLTCLPYQRVNEQNYNYSGTSINGTVFMEEAAFSEITIQPKNSHTKLQLKIKSGNSTITVNTSLTRILTSMK